MEAIAGIIFVYVIFSLPVFIFGRYLFRWGKFRYGYSTPVAALYVAGGLLIWPFTLLLWALRGFPRLPSP